ncbi:hypothetical protein HMPREF7545_1736 [Selenomonas noxia ATCC 43541]|uniref:major capsid protein n=1 Tax=Selenomonas noxia TaxID=135083 RepID=UPI0001BCEF16|nr:hypothetical protein [Selenomonas noxia]EFF65365.1 hypothetical protein HMPREF7545_1736 [Selenomonas noxia ATCC 43541]
MSDCVTLHEWAARFGAQGQLKEQKIIELQSKTNRILDVMPFKQCNTKTMEEAPVRAELPDVAWRIINKGVKPSHSKSKMESFTCGGMEALAQIDEKLMQINGNDNAWRLSENIAHQEAMNQEMAATFFYGDEKVTPAKFTGLSSYYYSKTTQDRIWADQIIDAGGTGSALTSLWLVGYSMDTIYGIFPEGTSAGFRYKDNGRQALFDKEGNKYYGYESQYNWDMGLCVRDPRYVVRVANIDTSKLAGTEADAFVENLIRAYNQIENPDKCTMAFFGNRAVQTYLDILASKKTNVRLSIDEFGGKKITHFWGVPVLRCDAILNTESKID